MIVVGLDLLPKKAVVLLLAGPWRLAAVMIMTKIIMIKMRVSQWWACHEPRLVKMHRSRRGGFGKMRGALHAGRYSRVAGGGGGVEREEDVGVSSLAFLVHVCVSAQRVKEGKSLSFGGTSR